MPVSRRLLAAALALCATPALAQPQGPGETLLLFPIPGWVEARPVPGEVLPEGMSIVLPASETVQTWTQLMSVHVQRGLTTKDPEMLLRETANAGLAQCDAVGAGPVQKRIINGYSAAMIAVGCNRDKASGKGEIGLILAIQGRENSYVIRRAWRGPAFGPKETPAMPPALRQEWLDYMDQVMVCDLRDPQRPCPKP